jgi:tetratricopeptide (TPR) repeat protein
MTPRISRKQLKQDKFVEVVFGAWNYARQNVLVTAAGVVFFVALVGLAFKIGGSVTGGPHLNEDAQRSLATARTEFGLGRFDAGAAALEDLVARYGGSRAAREATFLLGNAYFEAGDFARARETFTAFLGNPLYGDLMRDGAHLAIAACYEETADPEAAMHEYLSLWQGGSNPAARLDAALGAARCALAEGNRQRARAIYEEVSKTYPDSPQAAQAGYELLLLPAEG